MGREGFGHQVGLLLLDVQLLEEFDERLRIVAGNVSYCSPSMIGFALGIAGKLQEAQRHREAGHFADRVATGPPTKISGTEATFQICARVMFLVA